MGPAGFHGCPWMGIFLSASLLSTWTPPVDSQFIHYADLHSNTQKGRASLAIPTLSLSQSTVTEQKDMTTLYCDTADDNVTIRWVSNNSPLVLNERMKLSEDHKTLTILLVQREDSGSYQCEARRGPEGQSSNSAFLNVNYGPDPVAIKVDSGITTGDVVEVVKGQTVNFWVETQSHPAPDYTWYLPTDSIQYPITGTFTIQAVSKEHEGLYRCLVSNSVTQLSSLGVVKLQVLENLTAPYIEHPILDLVENMTSVNLTCKTSHQGVGVQWFLKGQLLGPSDHQMLSSQNRSLIIHSLQRDDTGPYECEVWNWAHRARSAPLSLTINYGPDRVDITPGSASGVVNTIEAMLNSSLTLQCQADSKPDARFHWTHEYFPEGYTGAQLSIEALSWEHGGIYSCTGSNYVTGLAQSASVLVKVVGPPSSSLSPGAIAGIVIGILVTVALVAGLGYFFYSRKGIWTCKRSKRSADDTTLETMPPASVKQSSPQSRARRAESVCDNMPKLQREARSKAKEPPSAAFEGPRKPQPPIRKQPLVPLGPKRNLESDYEKEPPSAAFEGPRKPQPPIRKQPLVPPGPKRDLESNYEKEPPSAAFEGPRKPQPPIRKQPLVPPGPKRDLESNYEKEPPSADFEGPRKPQPPIRKQPLVPPGPKRDLESNYEKEPPSAAFEGPRKPQPPIRKQPLVPPGPKRDLESNYEKEPPSADFEGPRKPQPPIRKQPLVPPGPKRDLESNYEKEPPSAAFEGPRKPQPPIRKQPLVPPGPKRDLESNYEKEPPSADFEGPRKPQPPIRKQPLVPPGPKRNLESDYEKLENPNHSLYCKIDSLPNGHRDPFPRRLK